MELKKVCYIFTLLSVLLLSLPEPISNEETSFELPVQLVGFPFIILSVRLTNFVKQLAYSLNPATYRSRTRRAIASLEDVFDAPEVEKYIVREFGSTTCIYERVCVHYAVRAQARPRPQLDWRNVFSQYNRSPEQNKEFYLLSVFLGDIIASPQLCHQLAKRRPCEPADFR